MIVSRQETRLTLSKVDTLEIVALLAARCIGKPTVGLATKVFYRRNGRVTLRTVIEERRTYLIRIVDQ